MFNIGPLEFLVLAAVALMVFGPDKLPQLTKDAARMLRTLRDLAQGARTTLTSELGPEFANFDLNSLNPKTAIRNALLGDDDLDLAAFNPKDILQRAMRGEDDAPAAKVSMDKVSPDNVSTGNVSTGNASTGNVSMDKTGPAAPTPQPPAHGERPPYDPDAT